VTFLGWNVSIEFTSMFKKVKKVKKVKVRFFYSATYSNNAATSRAVQS